MLIITKLNQYGYQSVLENIGIVNDQKKRDTLFNGSVASILHPYFQIA